MRILTYRDLRPGRFSKALDRLRVAISQGNFAAAGLKKLSPTNYWRAKLQPHRFLAACATRPVFFLFATRVRVLFSY